MNSSATTSAIRSALASATPQRGRWPSIFTPLALVFAFDDHDGLSPYTANGRSRLDCLLRPGVVPHWREPLPAVCIRYQAVARNDGEPTAENRLYSENTESNLL